MRRIGNLYCRICDRDNIRLAYWKARRGKAARPDVIAFGADLDAKLDAIEADLRDCRWDIGHYSHFTIHDPKERLITAAPFRERVIHHAVMNVCEPFFEKWQTDSSHACRKGRGLDSALAAALRHARANAWHLKLDIRKYFDSIPHDRLLAMLARRFKDETLLELFHAILETYETEAGRGLPIGNLTSQFFANFYLEPLDRFVKETQRAPGYVRYMDDFVLWGGGRDSMCRWDRELRGFCFSELALEVKPPIVNRVGAGLPFLGYVLRPSGLRLSAQSRRRYALKMKAAIRAEDAVRALALRAFAARADTLSLRRIVVFGASDKDSNRVNRGGSWFDGAGYCRSANRDRNNPGNRNNNLGFRVALSPSQEMADAVH